MVWAYSPAIKKVRQLTGSNRSDPIVGGVLSTNDFLGWSEKHELVDVNYLGESTFLAPVLVNEYLKSKEPGKSKDSCVMSVSTTNSQSGTFIKWIPDGAPEGAPWAPLNVVFVPRSFFVLELLQKDPFSLDGREILYVDTESMLPVYKGVFDRSGTQIKAQISIFAPVMSVNKTKVAPVLIASIVVGIQKNMVDVLEPVTYSYCDSFGDKYKISIFDPRKLGSSISASQSIAVPKKMS